MSDDECCLKYHRWYYDTGVWKRLTFLGVPVYKSVGDLWNYQEILCDLKPSLIVEFGAHDGGSTLYLATMARLNQPGALTLSVDIDLSRLSPNVRADPSIRFMECSSADPCVAGEIISMRRLRTGSAFFIVDSDHRKAHVLAELELLRGITQQGDYVVVEDGNVNGHPVLPDWGEGPWEALEEYFTRHPGDYRRDEAREAKFGWTFAPHGYLIRN